MCDTKESKRWIKSRQLCINCYYKVRDKKRREKSFIQKYCFDCKVPIKQGKSETARCDICCGKHWYKTWSKDRAKLPHYKFVAAKAVAKRRKRKWEIDFDQYLIIIQKGCFYCNKNLLEENGGCLDRKNNEIDYLYDNLVGCCKICNRAKDILSIKDFTEHVTKIYNCMRIKNENAID